MSFCNDDKNTQTGRYFLTTDFVGINQDWARIAHGDDLVKVNKPKCPMETI